MCRGCEKPDNPDVDCGESHTDLALFKQAVEWPQSALGMNGKASCTASAIRFSSAGLQIS